MVNSIDEAQALPYARAVYKRRAGPAAALLAIAAALAIPAAAAEGGPASAEGGTLMSLRADVAAIASLGPRVEGSAAEGSAFDYIAERLRAAGLEPKESGLEDAVEGCSNSRVIEAEIAGARPDELAVVVPVGSWARRAALSAPSDGAYGIALALDEAARLEASLRSGATLPVSLRFIFLGAEKRGEEREGGEASLGSATWIARQEGRTRLAVVYLNLASEPGRVALHSAGRGVLAPYWYYHGITKAIFSSGMALDLESNRLQAYRLALATDYGPAAPYLEAGIPAVEFRGEPPTPGSATAGELWLDLALRSFAAAEKEGFADTWDRHYFVFQVGSLDLTLREGTYIIFLVISFAAIACSLLVATVARRKAAAQVLRRVPMLGTEVLALFIALALVFLAGKGIAALDALALGSSKAWTLFPRIFAFGRVLFSFLLFLSLLSFLVERRILTPNPYFYEFAALVCLTVDSLLFSALDLAASFYFIWALAFVEVSLAVRRRWATLLAYVLMYAPLLAIALELAARPELSSYARLVDPSFRGILALSAVALPFFVFTASPVLFFAKRGDAARKRAALVLASLALAIEAIALCGVLILYPTSGPGRKDIVASEFVDQDSGEFRIELAGQMRLGRGILERGAQKLPYDSLGDRAYVRGEESGARIRLKESSSPFLDRLDESIALDFADPPDSVELSLESPGEMLIYDCNLPIKVAVDGRSATIYAPAEPGPRLLLSLTAPESFGARLVVEANYLSSLERVRLASGTSVADGGLTVRAGFDLGRARP
jgi:hypothetical protein